MKQYRFLLGTYIFFFICWTLAFVSSCSKDDEPIKTISQDVVNNYEFKGVKR